MKNYEITYEEFWKPLLEKNGVLEMDRLKQELHDYMRVRNAVRVVYDVVTGGVLSKPDTDPETVIWAFNEHVIDRIEQALSDAGYSISWPPDSETSTSRSESDLSQNVDERWIPN